MEGRFMKAKAIDILKKLYQRDNIVKYPNIPAHARYIPKYCDTTANGLTKCIIDFINLIGGQSERINNTGRQLDKRKTYSDTLGNIRTIGSVKWIKGTGTDGTADISATIKGRSVKVEVKIKADRQSIKQKEYQQAIEKAGGIYYIAKDFDTFYQWYNLKFKGNGKGY